MAHRNIEVHEKKIEKNQGEQIDIGKANEIWISEPQRVSGIENTHLFERQCEAADHEYTPYYRMQTRGKTKTRKQAEAQQSVIDGGQNENIFPSNRL